MKSLSAREQRLIALALALAAAAMAWLMLIQPVIDGFSARSADRARLLEQYAQNERLISRIARLRRTAEEQRKQQTLFGLSAANAEQGGERLKERLEAALQASGGEFLSAETIEAPAGWTKAGAQARVTDRQLVDWLVKLNNEPPYIAVTGLSVTAERAMNSNRLDVLDVKIEATIPIFKTVTR